MFKNESDFKKLIDRLGIDDRPNPAHREDLRRQMLSVFNDTRAKPLRAATWQIIGRTIMKGRITKLAAAAVIIIAILVGIHHFGGSINVTTVALGDVLERVEQAQAFIYRMKMTVTGPMMQGMTSGEKKVEGTTTISNSYGMKMEMTMTDANSGQEEMNQQMYILPDEKAAFMIMPEQKKYVRMEFDDDLLARMKKQNNDPREMIKQIMNCQYTELGRSVIDGLEVEGFRTTDPSFSGGSIEDVNVTLWVDVKQWLPVRTEMNFKMNEQMQMSGIIYDYQWDISVDAGEFEPVIPEDFTALSNGGVKMPSMTEEAAVEGLKFFVEMSGQYPKKLNLMNLMQEFSAIMQGFLSAKEDENLPEAVLKLREKMKQMKDEEDAGKAMELMRPVQSLGMFYMMLVQDRKDPAYYGESVGPNDTDLVLLRWKISDDEYRVIFGDLTAENVTAEELAELEEQLP